MNPAIERINTLISPIRKEIIQHELYAEMQSLDDIRAFMQFHVYAVWDFMSLLKTLQNELTCTRVPWFPVGDAETRHLINEIVVGEESDVDAHGKRKSHFELYLDAMQQCGADTSGIEVFIHALKSGKSLEESFEIAKTPAEARAFVRFTFRIINSGKAHLQAAIFTFGREDLIPDMFHAIVEDLHQQFPEQIATFKYYLERHIEVDGDHHSHLALKMTANLCADEDEKWSEAEQIVLESLEKRALLWEGAKKMIVSNKTHSQSFTL